MLSASGVLEGCFGVLEGYSTVLYGTLYYHRVKQWCSSGNPWYCRSTRDAPGALGRALECGCAQVREAKDAEHIKKWE